MLKKFRDEKRAAFIPFIVAGHPTLEASEQMIDVLVEEGADLIEVGVPFSDAMADGPVIQAASESASKRMDSVSDTLAMTAKVHAKYPKLPLILFTYLNPLLQFGLEKFAALARNSGIAAVLVVDLPPEEAKTYREILARQNLKTIFLASPTTSNERAKMIADSSTGFLYYVSRTGVTGVQKSISSSLAGEVAKIRSLSDAEIAVGFGISTGEQAAEVARIADGVVVGSAFVKLTDATAVRALAREIAASIRNARNLQTTPKGVLQSGNGT